MGWVNMNVAAVLSLVGLLSAANACRRPTVRQDADNNAAAARLILPRQTGEAKPESASPLAFDVDERTGRPKVNLVVRLDHFPDPKPGVTNLPVCYAAFSPDFAIGVAVCDGKPEVRIPITAKNIDQDCYTDPTADRVAATEPMTLPGCRRGGLVVHPFEPPLKVDLELRDTK